MATTLYEAVLTATTGSIAAGAASTLSLSIGGNNAIVKKIKIVPSVVGSGELTRVKLFKKSTVLDADRCFDTGNFEGNLYAPKYDDGTGPAELNEGYVCDYEDLDATGKLNVKLLNNGVSAKTFTYSITIQLTEKGVSGEYTPTPTNTTNITASTAYVAQWLRMGDRVVVGFRFDLDPTLAAPTATEFQFNPPIPSDFTSTSDALGSCIFGQVSGQAGSILADTATNRFSVIYSAINVGNATMTGTLVYRVR